MARSRVIDCGQHLARLYAERIVNSSSAGMGVSILPASAERLGTENVVSLSLKGGHPYAELGLAQTHQSSEDPLISRFVMDVMQTMGRRRPSSGTD